MLLCVGDFLLYVGDLLVLLRVGNFLLYVGDLLLITRPTRSYQPLNPTTLMDGQRIESLQTRLN